MGYILIHASDYLEPGDDIRDDIGGRWKYLLVNHARENGYEDRADIVEIISNTPERRDGRWVKSDHSGLTKKGNFLFVATVLVIMAIVVVIMLLYQGFQADQAISRLLEQPNLEQPNPKSCPDCDLSNADLTGADLSDANLYGADLTWANLAGADFTGALNVPAKYLKD